MPMKNMEHIPGQRTTRFEGHAFNVEQVQVLLPDGHEHIYDLVKHNDSVTIVPLDDDGRIVFVRQYRLGAEKMLLELPAGNTEPGEDPLECARREVREETGQAAKDMTLLGDFYLAPGYSNEHMFIYLATSLYSSPLDGDADEFIATEAIPVKAVFDLIGRNELNDSKSLAALLLAQPFLSKYDKKHIN